MVSQAYFFGVGKRKSAVARVRLIPGGAGAILVNGRPMEEVFTRDAHRAAVLQPLRVTENLERFNATVKISGGGISGWVGAISHGISRALVNMDDALRPLLRRHGLMTRDARVKERKKYGLKRARKAPQYTKR